MTKYIVSKYKDRGDAGRLAVGRIAGGVGIAVNVVLFAVKLALGLITGSVSVVADAVNNLSDAGSSAFVLVGYVLAGKPADREHPFGHARMEYLCGLFISVIITVLGLELFKSSAEKLFSGEGESTLSAAAIVIMVITMAIKVLLALFYRGLGNGINSMALKASATDSIGDVIATAAVIVGMLLSTVFGSAADALFGCAIAVYIIILGLKLVRESSDTLLGEAPDGALVSDIASSISSYEGVLGVHDLVVHSYGTGALYATVHVEVDSDEDVLLTHDRIDNIEADFLENRGIHLVIHMDPVCLSDAQTNEMRITAGKIVAELAKKSGSEITMHDFRMVQGPTHSNLIFDVAVGLDCKLSDREISQYLDSEIKKRRSNANCVITVDREYDSFRFGREED